MFASRNRHPQYVKTPCVRPSTESSNASWPSFVAAQRTLLLLEALASGEGVVRKLVLLALEPRSYVEWRREKADVGAQRLGSRDRSELPRTCAPEATVEEHFEEDSIRNIREELVEIVVEDVGPPIPVHVVRTDELVEGVGQLVAVAVPDLRSVPGEVEDDAISLLRSLNRGAQPVEDVRLRRALVDDDANVLVRDSEEMLQEPPDECDVVHRAAQRRNGGILVRIHSDQNGSDPGHGAPSVADGGTVTPRRCDVNDRGRSA